MKIAQVVTYIDANGSYGGPSSVAKTQAEALAALGHEVTIFAATTPGQEGTFYNNSYTTKLFPAKRLLNKEGFSQVYSMPMLRELWNISADFDVAHIHMARDLVSIPAAEIFRAKKVNYLLQTHGMISNNSKTIAKFFDVLSTKRILSSASRVFALTDKEACEINEIERNAQVEKISNGISLHPLPSYSGRTNRVLFLARLHEIKRPLAFVEMSIRLSKVLPETEFVLVGPDGGEGDKITKAIEESGIKGRLRWVGPISPEETDKWMVSALVYVLPSVHEVFPMSLIESLVNGTPVVSVESIGIAEDCRRFDAAFITDGKVESLANAVMEVISDDALAERLRAGGEKYLLEKLNINKIIKRIEAAYMNPG